MIGTRALAYRLAMLSRDSRTAHTSGLTHPALRSRGPTFLKPRVTCRPLRRTSGRCSFSTHNISELIACPPQGSCRQMGLAWISFIVHPRVRAQPDTMHLQCGSRRQGYDRSEHRAHRFALDSGRSLDPRSRPETCSRACVATDSAIRWKPCSMRLHRVFGDLTPSDAGCCLPMPRASRHPSNFQSIIGQEAQHPKCNRLTKIEPQCFGQQCLASWTQSHTDAGRLR